MVVVLSTARAEKKKIKSEENEPEFNGLSQ